MDRKLETGMYIINDRYEMVNFNQAVKALYPDVSLGCLCYKALALRDEPCVNCPLKQDNVLFYNPIRKEWIYANAAEINLPDSGMCYNVQFQLRQRVAGPGKEKISIENVDAHLAELNGGNEDVAAIGGYCGLGSPLFFANEQMVQLLGYENLEEMTVAIDGLVANTIHPDDLERVTKDLTKCAQEGGKFETAYRVHHKCGEWIWIVGRGKRIETETGVLVLLSVITDMRDYLHRQNKMREQNEALLKKELTSEAVLMHMPGGYHRCANEEGFPFLYISESFAEISGWTKQEIEKEFGNKFINLIVPEDIPVCMGIIDEIETKGYSSNIYRIHQKGGGFRWVLDSTKKVEIGEEIFYHGILADVTVYIEELNKARMHAEESSKAKSTFLFNISHDIRTPMNAIKGFTHMIGDHAEDAAFVRQTVDKIKRSTDTLMQLLNDVLELSRIESGKDQVNRQLINLDQFTQKLKWMFAGEMVLADISLMLDNRITHGDVLCDELKCSRIMMNMLSNAKKFTPAGGKITFGVEEVSCDGSTGQYRFFVRDTGIGMSEEFQRRAFDEFEREKTSTDSKTVGNGLGLAIIKRLVHTLGGSCTLKSKQGEGTEISVLLTLEQAGERHLSAEPERIRCADFTGKRILLVEDNEFNREIGRYVFEIVGFMVEEAENGAVCIEKLMKAGAGYYDLVLMDIQMPVMDGYMAAQYIRGMEDAALAKIPIVAMTANAFLEDREHCMAVGMNGHLAKPLEANIVIQELSRVLGQRRSMKQSKKRSKAFITNIMIIMVIIISFAFAAMEIRQFAHDDCFQRIEEETQQLSEMFEHKMNEHRDKLTMFTDVLEANSRNSYGTVLDYMEAFCRTQSFSALCIHTMDGISVSYGDHPHWGTGAIDWDAVGSEIFYVSEVFYQGETADERCFYIAVPIGKEGEEAATLYGYVPLNVLPAFFPATAYNNTCQINLVDGNTGDFMMDTWHEGPLSNVYDGSMGDRETKSGYDIETMRSGIRDGESSFYVFRSRTTGDWFYTYYMPTGFNNWSIQLTIDEDTAFARYNEVNRIILMLAVCVLLCLGLHVLILTVSSIEQRRQDQKRLQKSNYMYRVQQTLFNAHNNTDLMDQALKIVAEEMKAETVMLLTFDEKIFNSIYVWPSKDLHRANDLLGRNVRADFPVLYDMLLEHKSVLYSEE